MEPQKWIHKFDDSSAKEKVQIYEDKGEGFREEESYFIKDAYEGENQLHLTLNPDGNVTVVRIDPAMDYCAVRIKQLLFNGIPVEADKKNIITNGRRMKNGSYVFATEDPNINIRIGSLDRKAENELEIEMEIVRLPAAIAQDMAEAVKKVF